MSDSGGLPAVDVAELDAFLATHASSSMYLRAALHGGADRRGFALRREHGAIVAVTHQLACGMMVLQAPVNPGALAAATLRHTGRRLRGFFGPLSQVQAARREMGLDAVPFLKNTHEDLFTLPLGELVLPAALSGNALTCRVALAADFELLVAWRVGFRQQALSDAPGAQLEKTSRADIAALLAAESLFILESGQALACCSFNARLPDMVQVGNVWTPPGERGNGYARAVVAGALMRARAAGVATAVLSTGGQNLPAQAVYRRLGFKLIGDYATATIAPDTALPAW